MDTATPASSPPSGPHLGRRHYLIDLPFQLKYTALVLLFGGSIMGLFGAAVWHEIRTNSELLEGRSIAASLGAAAPTLSDFHESLAAADRRLLLLVAGSAIVVMAGLGLCGVLLTHRIAGPILVLTRYTKALGEGGFPAIRPLRRGDELQAFFETFRGAVEELRARQAQEVDAIEQAVAQLARPGRTDGPEALAALEALAARKRATLPRA